MPLPRPSLERPRLDGPPLQRESARSGPSARLVPLSELGTGDVARWRELAGHASEPNPFFEPEFALPAAARLGQGVELLVAEDGDGWCGCLPVQSAAKADSWKHVPVRGLVSWNHLYCFLGTPLLRKGSELSAARALIREGASVGFLGLDRLGSAGPVAQALTEACDSDFPLVKFVETERAGVRRSADGWSLQLNGKRQREVRRQRRRMAEQLGAEVETVDRAGDPSAVEQFLRLEASGWKSEHGTALSSDPAHAALFREVCQAFAERDRLQLLSLEAGGSPFAMLSSLVASETLFQFKIAFDEDSAHFGPGIQIETDAVEMMDAALPGVRMIDSCAEPSNAMANRLFPDRVALETVAIPGGFSGRRNLTFMRAALKTRNAIRRLK